MDIVADEAMEWLKAHGAEKPFAASFHFREPHTSYLPVRDEDWDKVKHLEDPVLPHPDYQGLDVARAKKMTREYLASVAAIDRNLGRIMAVFQPDRHVAPALRHPLAARKPERGLSAQNGRGVPPRWPTVLSRG